MYKQLKLGMADDTWKEKGIHKSLWEEIKIIGWGEYWRIRCLIEAVYMLLGHSDLLSRPSIEMNMIWEPLIKMAWF